MGTIIAARGITTSRQELPQDRGFAKQQAQSAAARAAALEQFESSLPGNRNPSEKTLDISTAVADLEKVSLAFNRRLKFEIDHKSHEITVKVIDGNTDKVIKILPPEELQRLHRNIEETIGFLFDERV
jgi:flagellar protein FlaG